MVSGMFAKLAAATAALILLAGCASPTMMRTPEPADTAGFINGYRELFPEAVTIGQTDQQIIDGSTELCQQIHERGIGAYKNYIISTTDDVGSQRRLTALVDLANDTIC